VSLKKRFLAVLGDTNTPVGVLSAHFLNLAVNVGNDFVLGK
jgi:hypothetical protein